MSTRFGRESLLEHNAAGLLTAATAALWSNADNVGVTATASTSIVGTRDLSLDETT